MTKKVFAVLMALLMVAAMVAGCASTSPAPASEATPAPAQESKPADTPASKAEEPAPQEATKNFTLGYLAWGLTDEWNLYGCEAFKWAAAKKGCEVITLDCQKDPEKQVSQAEELINRGVDAISMFPCTPEVGATVTRMCNVAGIPIAIENIFLPDDGSAGEIVGQVACRYSDIGYTAVKYAAETWPGCKLLYVHGGPGLGVYEDYKVGVDQALEEFKGKIELVGLMNGNWETEASYNVTQDFISSGKSDFDVVFANNDLQAVGVYNALKENGMENIPILSTGGSEQGYEMVKSGQEYANMTAPVNLQGEIVFRFLWQHLNNVSISETKIPLPVIPVDQTNIDTDWIKWSDYEAAERYIGGITP